MTMEQLLMTVLTSAQKIYVENLVHVDVNVTALCSMTHALLVKKKYNNGVLAHLKTLPLQNNLQSMALQL